MVTEIARKGVTPQGGPAERSGLAQNAMIPVMVRHLSWLASAIAESLVNQPLSSAFNAKNRKCCRNLPRSNSPIPYFVLDVGTLRTRRRDERAYPNVMASGWQKRTVFMRQAVSKFKRCHGSVVSPSHDPGNLPVNVTSDRRRLDGAFLGNISINIFNRFKEGDTRNAIPRRRTAGLLSGFVCAQPAWV